jgi:cell division protein FtsB
MRQQVNLLAPIFRKQRTLFSARISLAACAAVVLVLGVVYAVLAWRGAWLAGEQARLERARDAATQQLAELSAPYQGRGKNEALDAELVALTNERDRKAQAASALSRSELVNTRGFSPQFLGLARQRLNGLWLTRVEVSGAGSQMALDGVTLSEELLPRYLKKLGTEEVFAGAEFGHARLIRPNPDGNQIRFELRTRVGAGAAP